jgi:SAM-dependent methyltransferase
VLDVGCGGGLFLSLLKQRGAHVTGIEVDHRRAEYARTTYDLTIETRPVENPESQLKYRSFFDIVTLWDVIEHVNFPQETLRASHAVLKQSGFLFIDTPCRDAFYHRFGALSYAVSRGRWPGFLNIMYSGHLFGHKQIFSTGEMQDILSLCGFAIDRIEKQHELSFPYEFYLERLFGSQKCARILLPLVELLFRVVRIRNKMIVVARKTT